MCANFLVISKWFNFVNILTSSNSTSPWLSTLTQMSCASGPKRLTHYEALWRITIHLQSNIRVKQNIFQVYDLMKLQSFQKVWRVSSTIGNVRRDKEYWLDLYSENLQIPLCDVKAALLKILDEHAANADHVSCSSMSSLTSQQSRNTFNSIRYSPCALPTFLMVIGSSSHHS